MVQSHEIHSLIKGLDQRSYTITDRTLDHDEIHSLARLPALDLHNSSVGARVLVKYAETDLPLIARDIDISCPTAEQLSDYNPDKLPLPPPPPLPPPTPKTQQKAMAQRLGIVKEGGEIGIDLPWIADRETNEAMRHEIKQIPGRRWDPQQKVWWFPVKYTIRLAQVLEEFFPKVSDALRNSGYQEEFQYEEITRLHLSSALTLDAFPELQYLDEKLDSLTPNGLTLYPHQKAGIGFIETTGEGGKGHGAIIGDKMGLGKTMQAIGFTLLHPTKTLVVSPVNPKFNWAKEIRKWNPSAKVAILVAKSTVTKKMRKQKEKEGIQLITVGDRIPKNLDYLICSYNQLRGILTKTPTEWRVDLKKAAETVWACQFQTIIIDECQNIGNYKSQQTIGTIEIAKACTNRIALSGTPIKNRPADFFTVLRLIKPSDFNSWSEFISRYCASSLVEFRDRDGEFQSHIDWRKSSVTNWEELHSKISTCMIRREKSQVLKDLPPKIRQVIEIPLSEMGKYERKERKLLTTGLTLMLVQELRIMIARKKVDIATSMAIENIENDGCTIIFHHFREIGNEIEYLLREKGFTTGRIHGETSAPNRSEEVDKFQNGQTQAMIISIQAGGTGISLTRASTVLFVEPDWTPANIEQAEDRPHRIGQQNSVLVTHLKAPGTIDEIFYDRLEQKSDMIGKVLDGEGGNISVTNAVEKYLRKKYAK